LKKENEEKILEDITELAIKLSEAGLHLQRSTTGKEEKSANERINEIKSEIIRKINLCIEEEENQQIPRIIFAVRQRGRFLGFKNRTKAHHLYTRDMFDNDIFEVEMVE
jgi:23S rRNA maturation-related 3'-5' exoribonuclease YhaM